MGSDLANILKQQGKEFHPIVPYDPVKDRLITMDMSMNNAVFSGPVLSDTKNFTAYINEVLEKAGARYAIGGYAELRTVYSASKVFDGKDEHDEPRRFHLGIDIWGKPYTKVLAPLDGIVHSFAFNNNFGDYGVTIILSHSFHGTGFYTLYGHLSMNSIKDKQEGMTIKKGDVFAEFGIPVENGHWPPHLHFQVIKDIGEYKGDYPGVCKYSEREIYLDKCPDPDLILQMMQYTR